MLNTPSLIRVCAWLQALILFSNPFNEVVSAAVASQPVAFEGADSTSSQTSNLQVEVASGLQKEHAGLQAFENWCSSAQAASQKRLKGITSFQANFNDDIPAVPGVAESGENVLLNALDQQIEGMKVQLTRLRSETSATATQRARYVNVVADLQAQATALSNAKSQLLGGTSGLRGLPSMSRHIRLTGAAPMQAVSDLLAHVQAENQIAESRLKDIDLTRLKRAVRALEDELVKKMESTAGLRAQRDLQEGGSELVRHALETERSFQHNLEETCNAGRNVRQRRIKEFWPTLIRIGKLADADAKPEEFASAPDASEQLPASATSALQVRQGDGFSKDNASSTRSPPPMVTVPPPPSPPPAFPPYPSATPDLSASHGGSTSNRPPVPNSGNAGEVATTNRPPAPAPVEEAPIPSVAATTNVTVAAPMAATTVAPTGSESTPAIPATASAPAGLSSTVDLPSSSQPEGPQSSRQDANESPQDVAHPATQITKPSAILAVPPSNGLSGGWQAMIKKKPKTPKHAFKDPNSAVLDLVQTPLSYTAWQPVENTDASYQAKAKSELLAAERDFGFEPEVAQKGKGSQPSFLQMASSAMNSEERPPKRTNSAKHAVAAVVLKEYARVLDSDFLMRLSELKFDDAKAMNSPTFRRLDVHGMGSSNSQRAHEEQVLQWCSQLDHGAQESDKTAWEKRTTDAVQRGKVSAEMRLLRKHVQFLSSLVENLKEDNACISNAQEQYSADASGRSQMLRKFRQFVLKRGHSGDWTSADSKGTALDADVQDNTDNVESVPELLGLVEGVARVCDAEERDTVAKAFSMSSQALRIGRRSLQEAQTRLVATEGLNETRYTGGIAPEASEGASDRGGGDLRDHYGQMCVWTLQDIQARRRREEGERHAMKAAALVMAAS